ncbi:class F sortase [Streptomyces sp. PSRA5]|uniref:class F sortase n=1 Tax=Streptomyces panacea TaxID=3035064 RepID=UPI00339CD2A5
MKGTGRRGAWTAAACVCALASALTLGTAVDDRQTPPPRVTSAGTVPADSSPDRSHAAGEAGMARSVPLTVTVPGVGLSAKLRPVRLTDRGEMPIPADPAAAGWLESSAAPGENGTAVLAGHVDTPTGPAAFYELSGAEPGMRIEIRRTDGTTAHFTVDAVAVHPKDRFPERVYTPTAGPSLRLITCTGWDNKTRTYRDNVVVYATPRATPRAH